MAVNFNVGSDQFTRIPNVEDLVVGTNYLIRYRVLGKQRNDYIGQYRGLVNGILNFDLLYSRQPRTFDTGPYNPWQLYVPDISPYLRPIFRLNEFRPGTIDIFSSGPKGSLISRTNSPDAIRESELREIDRSLDALSVKSGTPEELMDHIKSYLGGKRKYSRRRSMKKRRKRRTRNRLRR